MFVKGSLVQGIYPPKPLTKQFYRLNSSAYYVYYVNKIKKGKVNVKRAFATRWFDSQLGIG
jgi:hypothetical protein